MRDTGWRPRLKALLHALWQWPLALLILFEEWGWEPLQRVLARIGAWRGLRWIESAIRRLPPYAALAPWLMNLRDRLPRAAEYSERMAGFSARRSLPKWRWKG